MKLIQSRCLDSHYDEMEWAMADMGFYWWVKEIKQYGLVLSQYILCHTWVQSKHQNCS